ncbi:LLM class flavin-dependent oxidoreductase [Streptomyces sp. NPDC002688]|jgi:luciferase family oxidoreductase group 1|uniref:LLM class flavin-dependent oxidoreductase n=1 Tax=Streptomyces sp. NPDC002688 TaxID=3154423 RepID=UPI00331725AE
MSELNRIRYSVLDIAPVMSGSTSAQALRNTLDLARRAEEFGFHRYWLAEHHNTGSIASSSPAVLAGQVAASTASIRVGSGGVMLPNHQPLVVAEQFGTLAALHPGRIDLGLGRAPGGDPLTAQALRRDPLNGVDFPEQVREILGYATGENPITANPVPDEWPPVWILGSGGGGPRTAGELGLPFASAHHFTPQNTVPGLQLYRRSFRPSRWLQEAYAVVAAVVVLADTDAEAQRLAASLEIAHLKMLRGKLGPYVSPEEADREPFTAAERQMAKDSFVPQFVGGPETVRRSLGALVRASGADEIMALTIVHDHAARVRSYELLAQVCESLPLSPESAVAGAE